MRKVISIAALALMITAPLVGFARTPATSMLDARARAMGNRRALAVSIGERLFLRTWAAQILSVRVDGIGRHSVAGLALSGVKFHKPLTKSQFIQEIVAITGMSFAATRLEEVDLWCSVPLWVGKGAIVSGDLAVPTSRTVFAVTVRREEPPHSLYARLRAGNDVFWDADWARKAFRPG